MQAAILHTIRGHLNESLAAADIFVTIQVRQVKMAASRLPVHL